MPPAHTQVALVNLPISSTTPLRINVTETLSGKAKLIHSLDSSTSSSPAAATSPSNNAAVPSMRITLVHECPDQSWNFSIRTAEHAFSTTVTRDELLAETAATKGFTLVADKSTTGVASRTNGTGGGSGSSASSSSSSDGVEQLANELYEGSNGSSLTPSSSASTLPTLLLLVELGPATVLTPSSNGRSRTSRDFSAKDISNRPRESTGIRGVKSIAMESMSKPDPSKIVFKGTEKYDLSSVRAMGVTLDAVEIEIATLNLPGLNRYLVEVSPVIAIFSGAIGNNPSTPDLLLAYTELGTLSSLPGQPTYFKTRLVLPRETQPYLIKVYDACEEELSKSQMIAESEVLYLETLNEGLANGTTTRENPLELQLTSKNSGLEKKLRKKNAKILITAIREYTGSNGSSSAGSPLLSPTAGLRVNVPLSSNEPKTPIKNGNNSNKYPTMTPQTPSTSHIAGTPRVPLTPYTPQQANEFLETFDLKKSKFVDDAGKEHVPPRVVGGGLGGGVSAKRGLFDKPSSPTPSSPQSSPSSSPTSSSSTQPQFRLAATNLIKLNPLKPFVGVACVWEFAEASADAKSPKSPKSPQQTTNGAAGNGKQQKLIGCTEITSNSASASFLTPLTFTPLPTSTYRIDLFCLGSNTVPSEKDAVTLIGKKECVGYCTLTGSELSLLQYNIPSQSFDLKSDDASLQKKIGKKGSKLVVVRANEVAVQKQAEPAVTVTVPSPSPMKEPTIDVLSPISESPQSSIAVQHGTGPKEETSHAAGSSTEDPRGLAQEMKTGGGADGIAPLHVESPANAASSMTGTGAVLSPQHLEEQDAAVAETSAVEAERKAKERVEQAEKRMREMESSSSSSSTTSTDAASPTRQKNNRTLSRGSISKATLAWQQAEAELREAREAQEKAAEHAAAARANLAAKRAARIAEEDRLAAEAAAARAANPNMTLWGERRRGGSRPGSRSASQAIGADVETVINARRAIHGSGHARPGSVSVAGSASAPASAASSLAPSSPRASAQSCFHLLRVTLRGIKGTGCWKPVCGLYDVMNDSDSGLYLDHTERVDLSETGAIAFGKPWLVESSASEQANEKDAKRTLVITLFNMAGDKVTQNDLIGTARVPLAALKSLPAGSLLSIPLYRASNRSLKERLKRQNACVRLTVLQTTLAVASNVAGAGSIRDPNPPMPNKLDLEKDADKREFTVQTLADAAQQDVANEVSDETTSGYQSPTVPVKHGHAAKPSNGSGVLIPSQTSSPALENSKQ